MIHQKIPVKTGIFLLSLISPYSKAANYFLVPSADTSKATSEQPFLITAVFLKKFQYKILWHLIGFF